MQTQQVTFDSVKGYATYASAKKTGERVASACNVPVKWMILAKDDGRFVVVFVLKDENFHMMHWILSNPQCVIMNA